MSNYRMWLLHNTLDYYEAYARVVDAGWQSAYAREYLHNPNYTVDARRINLDAERDALAVAYGLLCMFDPEVEPMRTVDVIEVADRLVPKPKARGLKSFPLGDADNPPIPPKLPAGKEPQTWTAHVQRMIKMDVPNTVLKAFVRRDAQFDEEDAQLRRCALAWPKFMHSCMTKKAFSKSTLPVTPTHYRIGDVQIFHMGDYERVMRTVTVHNRSLTKNTYLYPRLDSPSTFALHCTIKESLK